MLIRFPRLRAFIECFWLAHNFAHYSQLVEQFRQEYHEWYIVHVRKTEWLFSGVDRSTRGITDLGTQRSPKPMNRAQAHRYLFKIAPHAVVIHVDDRHKIITFSLNK